MKFIDLNNIEELKKIFTPYILTALKEKYMKTYQKICRDGIIEEHKKIHIHGFVIHRDTIFHYRSAYTSTRDVFNCSWISTIAEFPKRYKYSSGLNCPNGFKEFDI